MTYKVFWGTATHLVEVPPGSDCVSGQPNMEEFDDKDSAYSRAFELGLRDSIRPFTIDDEFEEGEYTYFKDHLFKAQTKIEPYSPDFDEPESQLLPTVATTKWQLLQ